MNRTTSKENLDLDVHNDHKFQTYKGLIYFEKENCSFKFKKSFSKNGVKAPIDMPRVIAHKINELQIFFQHFTQCH